MTPITPKHSYHYGVIRRAIETIDASTQPLSLEDLAAEAGMSPAHFQRTFSAWAGVSPKRFQQFLTLGHAKTLLRDRFTTLDAAHAVGLSGTSRFKALTPKHHQSRHRPDSDYPEKQYSNSEFY